MAGEAVVGHMAVEGLPGPVRRIVVAKALGGRVRETTSRRVLPATMHSTSSGTP